MTVRPDSRGARSAGSEDRSATVGVLTTQKLQAMLDCRCNPDVVSRLALAQAMTAAGARISVHGIDAWFRPLDSNYGIERDSLEPGRRCYAVPPRRWSVLLQIFGFEEADLELPDREFRKFCFARVRAARRKRTARPPVIEVLLLTPSAKRPLAAGLDGAIGMPDWLTTRVDCDQPDAEAALARRLRGAALLIVDAGPDGSDDPVLHAALERADSLAVPCLWLHDEPTGAPTNALPTTRTGTGRVEALPAAADRDQLVAAAQRLARTARLDAAASGTDWTPPEPITDRPAIAVLPFVNLTGDAEGAMLAASLTEDVTALLARIPEFFVIAHSTMRAFGTRHPDRRTLQQQLGVRHLLEGSLRSDGHTLRVSAELTDASNGTSLWSQRFERPLVDLFSMQDEIAIALCAQLEPRVRVADIAIGARSSDITSWRLWQEGWHLLFVDAPQPFPERSLTLFRRAIELEPDYALGHAGLAIALATALLWGGLGPDAHREARHHAEIAFKQLPEHPVALYAMGLITFVEPVSLRVPLEYITRAVELEPSNPMYQAVYGYLLASLGDPEAGVEKCRYAMRLSPKDSREPFLCYMLGAAYLANGQYELAIETMTRARRFSEVDFIWLMVAFAHAQLGETDRALTSLRRIEQPRPFGFYRWAIMESFWLTLSKQDKEAFLELLPKAGIV